MKDFQTLKEFFKHNSLDSSSVQKIINIIGSDESIVYLESLLKAFRNNKISPKDIGDAAQLIWIMELFSFGLLLPFNKYESINEILQLYQSWIRICFSENTEKVIPLPIQENPNFFLHKMIDHLVFPFYPRKDKSYQAMACIQILMIFSSFICKPSNLNEHNLITPDIWEHILFTLIRICDMLFNFENDDVIESGNLNNPHSSLSLGTLIGNQAFKTLFEVWIFTLDSVALITFPSVVFWNMLESFCKMQWKYRYIALIEQWISTMLPLTQRLIRQLKGQSSDKFDKDDNNKLLFIYWYKMLRILGSPQDIIFHCWFHTQQKTKSNAEQIDFKQAANILFDKSYKLRENIANTLHNELFPNEISDELKSYSQPPLDKNAKKSPSKPGSPTHKKDFAYKTLLAEQNHLHLCSLIYLRYITGISQIIDQFLGYSVNELRPDDETNKILMGRKLPPSMTDTNHSLLKAMPSLANVQSQQPQLPLKKKQSNLVSNVLPLKDVKSTSQRLSHNFSQVVTTDLDKVSNTSKQSMTSYLLNTLLPNRSESVSKDTKIPLSSCESLFTLFGDWLFTCAAFNENLEPFTNEIYFEYGKAEAIGTLCRMVNCLKDCGSLSNTYMNEFLAMLLSNINRTTHQQRSYLTITPIQACIILNINDLFTSSNFSNQTLMIAPSLLNVAKRIYETTLTNTSGETTDIIIVSQMSISTCLLRHACLQILQSLICLPSCYPSKCILHLESFDSLNMEGIESNSLTLMHLQKPIIDLLCLTLEKETYLTNISLLFDIVIQLFQQMASYKKAHGIPGDTLSCNIPNIASHTSAQAQSENGHSYWCFDCLFIRIVLDLILENYINKWIVIVNAHTIPIGNHGHHKEDYSIIIKTLNCLCELANIPVLIYKPLCETLIQSLCTCIAQMSSVLPTKHTRELHNTIICAFECIGSWIASHNSLIDDSNLLHKLIATIDIGVYGPSTTNEEQKSSGNIKNPLPISKRVAKSALLLLCSLVTLKTTRKNNNISNNKTLSTTPLNINSELNMIENKNDLVAYAACGKQSIVGVSNFKDDNFVLIIYNVFGRHVWNISLVGSPPRLQETSMNKDKNEPERRKEIICQCNISPQKIRPFPIPSPTTLLPIDNYINHDCSMNENHLENLSSHRNDKIPQSNLVASVSHEIFITQFRNHLKLENDVIKKLEKKPPPKFLPSMQRLKKAHSKTVAKSFLSQLGYYDQFPLNNFSQSNRFFSHSKQSANAFLWKNLDMDINNSINSPATFLSLIDKQTCNDFAKTLIKLDCHMPINKEFIINFILKTEQGHISHDGEQQNNLDQSYKQFCQVLGTDFMDSSHINIDKYRSIGYINVQPISLDKVKSHLQEKITKLINQTGEEKLQIYLCIWIISESLIDNISLVKGLLESHENHTIFYVKPLNTGLVKLIVVQYLLNGERCDNPITTRIIPIHNLWSVIKYIITANNVIVQEVESVDNTMQNSIGYLVDKYGCNSIKSPILTSLSISSM